MVWRVRGSQWYDVGSEGDGKMKGQQVHHIIPAIATCRIAQRSSGLHLSSAQPSASSFRSVPLGPQFGPSCWCGYSGPSLTVLGSLGTWRMVCGGRGRGVATQDGH